MKTYLINLLPKSITKAFLRDYRFRVATFGLVLVAFVIFINGLLLIPAYLYAHTHIVALQTKLNGIDQSTKTDDQTQITTRLSNLSKEQKYLIQKQKAPQASALLNAVLKVSRPGIALSSFTVTMPEGSGSGTIILAGNADTREDLRAYTVALGTLPFISSVNLPISAYASESDIAFTITLSGNLSL